MARGILPLKTTIRGAAASPCPSLRPRQAVHPPPLSCPFRLSAALTGLGMGSVELVLICLLALLLPLLERLPALSVREKQLRGRYAVPLLYFLLIAAIVACRCLVLTQHGATAFIYFQF